MLTSALALEARALVNKAQENKAFYTDVHDKIPTSSQHLKR